MENSTSVVPLNYLQHLQTPGLTPEQFCYWLQGYFEISGTGNSPLTAEQVSVINDHLRLVFNKVTPQYKYSQPLVGGTPIVPDYPYVTYTCGINGDGTARSC